MKALITAIKDKIQGKVPPSTKRSSQWPKVRLEHLTANRLCEVCAGKDDLEVHHILPFHLDSTKELDPANLITLCESKKYGSNCHLLFGHLGDYKKFNPDVEADSAIWFKKLGSKLIRVK